MADGEVVVSKMTDKEKLDFLLEHRVNIPLAIALLNNTDSYDAHSVYNAMSSYFDLLNNDEWETLEEILKYELNY